MSSIAVDLPHDQQVRFRRGMVGKYYQTVMVRGQRRRHTRPRMAAAKVKPRYRGVSHQVAFFVSLVAGGLLVAATKPGVPRIAIAVFAVSLAWLLGVSALYHRPMWPLAIRARRLQAIDHASIFILVAGTYTPFLLLLALKGESGHGRCSSRSGRRRLSAFSLSSFGRTGRALFRRRCMLRSGSRRSSRVAPSWQRSAPRVCFCSCSAACSTSSAPSFMPCGGPIRTPQCLVITRSFTLSWSQPAPCTSRRLRWWRARSREELERDRSTQLSTRPHR